MQFEVIQNDITHMHADAVVLPANEQLKEGSGTSRAIFEKAGRKELTKACRELRSCPVGEAVPTLAFKLDANYIIHAVVPKWVDGEHEEYEYLCAAYLSALKVADIMNCKSIAFPLLASGNNGFDLNLAYEIAKESFTAFESENLQMVYLVVYGDTIATFLRGKGVTVTNLQHIEKRVKENSPLKKILVQFRDEGKQLAVKVLEDELSKAIIYLKDPKNRKKIIDMGFHIAKIALEFAKKKK